MNKQDQEEAAARARGNEIIARVRQNQKEATTKAAKQAVNEGRAPYEVLGRDGKSVVLYSRERKGIVYLPAERVTASALILLIAPRAVLAEHIPDGADLTERQLTAAVRDDIAAKMGSRIYDPAKVRGAGIWLDPEGIIYSTGRDCYLLRDGEFEPRPVYPMRPDGTLYAAESAKAGMPAPADNALTKAEGRAIYELLAARTWEEAYAPELVAGWLVCSLLGGVLPVRPHLWINGAKGCGKSALRRDLQALCGGACHTPAGAESTTAGVRRMLEGTALPVLYDESETDGRESKVQRMQSLLSMARLSFDGDQCSPRAKDGGGVQMANLRSSFCLMSIRDYLEAEADYNRFHRLNVNQASPAELAALVKRREAGRALLERPDAPARLITRIMQQAHFVLRNTEAIAQRLEAAGIAGRRALMDGELLACRWALTDGGEASAEYLSRCEAIVREAEQRAQTDCKPEGEELLDVIMSYPCMTHPMKKNVRQAGLAVFFPQGDAASEAADLAELAKSALESIGIHPRPVDMRRKDEHAGQWCVVVQYRSKAFAPVVERSKWRGGHGIPAAIKSAPHAEVKTCNLNGKNTTYLLIYEGAFRNAVGDDET